MTILVKEQYTMAASKTVPSSSRLKSNKTRQLRLCYLVESFYPIIGGMETQSQLAIEWFSKQSLDITVVTRHVVLNSPRQENLFGAKVLRIPPSGGISGILRWPMMVTAFLQLVKLRKKFDLIFVDGFRTLGVPAVLAGRLLEKKVVLKPENVGEMSGAFFDGRLKKLRLTHNHWLVKLMLSLRDCALKMADAFCPISHDSEEECLQAGIEPNIVYLIPNAYDSNRFFPASIDEKSQLRKKFSLDEKRMVAIFTGRLDAMKGVQHLVRLWHEIINSNDSPLLLLVGPDSHGMFNCGDEIRKYIKTHNLQHAIIMTGGVRNVEEYLRLADVYVFPSQGGEGLPTSVIEAMACGLPVVTTRSTGLTDVVTEDTGMVIESTDLQGFGMAIVKMLRDEEYRNLLGRAAAEKVKQMYSPDIVYPYYLQIFHSLIEAGGIEAI